MRLVDGFPGTFGHKSGKSFASFLDNGIAVCKLTPPNMPEPGTEGEGFGRSSTARCKV